MVLKQSLLFYLFLYVCFLSPAHSQNVLSWPYYEGFVLDWIPKEGSTELKTAARPSAAVEFLSFLDGDRTEHAGDVWGLWDYGTDGTGTLSYKFNLTEYGSFFCGITSARLRIKYYSEGPNQGTVLHCTEAGSDNPEDTADRCGLPATDASMDWGDVSRPVRISENILEFEFTTQEGKNLIIDEVAMLYNLDPNDPACKQTESDEETNEQEKPQHRPGKLEQILNQFKQSFKQSFKQVFSFFNIFG